MPVKVDLDPDGRHIRIDAEWRYKELCKSLPGAKWKDEVWRVPLSWSSCLALRSTFRTDLEIGPGLAKWAGDERVSRIDPSMSLRDIESLDDADNEDLFPHQRAGVAFLSMARRALLADEPGVGKTAQAIRGLKKLHDNGEDVFPALIVCPNTLKKNWAREFEKWWPGVNVQVIKGTAAQRKKQFANEDAQVFCINWESLRSHSRLANYGGVGLKRCRDCGGEDESITITRCEVHPRELNSIDFKSVIADECFTGETTISTPQGARRIDSLRVGDPVWGFDHNTGQVVETRVTATMTRKSCTTIGVWNSTPNHPFYVAERGYVPVGDLVDEDILYAISNQEMQEMLPTIYRVRAQQQKEDLLLQDMLRSGQRDQSLVQNGETTAISGGPQGMRVVQNRLHPPVQEKKSTEVLFEEVLVNTSIAEGRRAGEEIANDAEASTRPSEQSSTSSAGTSELRQKSVLEHVSGAEISEREKRLAESSIWHEHQEEEMLNALVH